MMLLLFSSLVEEEEIEEPTSSSSTRTVIAPKDDLPTSSTQPLPPGTQEITSTVVKVEATPGYQQPVIPGYNPHPFIRPQRFHPYGGHRKPFDYNRIGGKDFSNVIRKPAFCICENKGVDQCLGFRYIDSTIPVHPESKISSL